MRAHLLAAPLSLLALAVGCADQVPEEPGVVDIKAPKILVTQPERGAVVGDVDTIAVEGTVTDDQGVAAVVVNGVPATVEADGTFRVTVPVFPGTNLVQTLAHDAAGNVGSDTRSALAGALSPVNKPLPDSVLATLSADTFQTIGDAAADFVETADLLGMAAAANPVIDVGGRDCLYVFANLNTLDLSTAAITLTPANGGVWMSARVTNLYAALDGHYKVACISGNDDLYASADVATVSGFLAMDIANGDFDLNLQAANVSFTNLEIDATGFPGAILGIVDFFASFEDLIADTIIDAVVPMVDDALAGLSQQRSVTVLGTDIDFAVRPSIIDVDAAGATIRLDTTVEVAGSAGGPGFVYTTNAVPNLDHSQGFGIGVADDVANELLSAFWAAGGMTQTLDLTTGSYGQIGALYDTVEISALLPPSVAAQTGAGLRLTVGDLLATFYLDGQVVTKIAVNGTVDLGADVSGGAMVLALSEPDVEVDIIDEGVTGTNALSGDAFEELISFAAGRLVGASGDLLGALPLPQIGGVGVTNASVGGVNGYLMVAGTLE
ncbi:MAG: hypothetical protein R2939_17940 [Kofleriaceae bacterium]